MILPVRHLLYIEDSEDDFLIVRDLLADIETVRIEVGWVTSYEAALDALALKKFDVCLLDYRLGAHTGLELLQDMGDGYGVPVIVLTGVEDYRIDSAVAAAGAADYLVKGELNAVQLERSIRYAIQHKAAEKALVQAQRLTQSIVDGLPDRIAVLDENGIIVNLNAAWKLADPDNCFVGACSPIGSDFVSLYDARTEPELRDIADGIRAVIESGTESAPYLSEHECLYQGRQHWFEMRASSLKGSDSPLVMVAFENITERKRADQQLRASEANLAQAQGMASMGSWELSLASHDRGARYWSDETYRILGYLPGEVEASFSNFLSVVHPDDVEGFTAYIEEFQKQPTSFVLDHRLLLPDGSIRFVQERIEPVFNEAGVPIKLVGTIQDITARTQEEALSRFQQTLLEAQSEASLDGILVVSTQGKVLSFNQRFATLWDVPPDLIETKQDEVIIASVYSKLVDPDQFMARVHYLYGHTGESSQDEIELKDGRILDRYSAPISGSDGFYYGRVWYFRDITERKMAAEALEKSNREMRTVWESMTDAFYAVDLEWRFTQINSQCAAILHKDPDAIIGKIMWDEFPHARDLAFYQEFHRSVEEQVPVVFEEFYAPLGIWTEVHAYPSPIGLSVYFRDISARRQAEQELRASEARFEGIVSNVPGMVYQFTVRPDGVMEFPFVSRGSLELMGLQPFEIRADSTRLSSLTHPDDRASFERSIQICVRNREPWHWEGRKKLPSGEVKWVQGDSHPRELPDGTVLWDGLLTDITNRKEAEEERDRFFTLSLDMLAIVDRNGVSKRLNAAFETTLGYSAEVLHATPLIDFVHPDDREMTRAQIAKFENGITELSFTNRNICADGSVKWLSWQAVLSGNVFYVVAHDITPVIVAEAALRQANDDLERKVSERTRELASVNEELRVDNVERHMMTGALREIAEAYRIAKDQSDSANQAKSGFLSRMSHELRTPLNAILGFGEILQDSGLTPEQNEQVEQILHGGWHLLDLINEVLDISRVETGDMDLSLESVAVADIINESCSLVSPLAAQLNVRLDIRAMAHAGFHVLADRQRLKQVLLNLLSNGIKYNRRDGEVSISCQAAQNGRIRIAVQDTGQGLTKPELEKLFTPFERLNAMESSIEGTGLGLALSKHLITAMGGQIEVKSTPGRGSTFSIDLAGTTPVAAKNLRSTESDRSHLILSIEDNPLSQSLLQQILVNRPEISLMAAARGELGLSLAAAHHPDLILLSLHLPDVSGAEVLNALQGNDVTKDIPVIMVSNHSSPAQSERLLAVGAYAHLPKPFDVPQLLEIFDKILAPEPVKAESPKPAERALRILVAEDNIVNQKVVSLHLQKLGHQPFICEDGSAVIEAWQHGDYDAILMDCHMPGKDGYAAAREIRALENGRSHIPIIALTANAMAQDRDRSLESGMDDHLSKPIKQAELQEILQRFCGQAIRPI